MGTVNNNFLPASTGLSLGSVNQKWLLNGFPAPRIAPTIVAYSATPAFQSSDIWPVFTITLTGDVTSSTFSLSGAAQAFVIFQITQDAIGGHAFAWPNNFLQPGVIGSDPNQTTTQMFYFDGTNAWPVSPAVMTP